MWSLLALKTRVTAIVAFTLAVTVARAITNDLEVASIFDVVGPFFSAAAVTTAAGVWLGRFRWTWRAPCRFGLRRWYPDLNGTWRGVATSSFPEGGAPYDIEMVIDQRWSGIKVATRGIKSGITTKTLVAVPTRDDGVPSLWMHFVGEQDRPSATDDRSWFGSSRLKLDPVTGHLSGVYWTDRASHILGSGGTAGTVLLTRF